MHLDRESVIWREGKCDMDRESECDMFISGMTLTEVLCTLSSPESGH